MDYIMKASESEIYEKKKEDEILKTITNKQSAAYKAFFNSRKTAIKKAQFLKVLL